ncbi:hypothetical protein IQ257_15695 [Coleofasciculus sp. LEGE 07092]|nr:hypothetical protein [Coleofasciculus sp. LEGE 07092]
MSLAIGSVIQLTLIHNTGVGLGTSFILERNSPSYLSSAAFASPLLSPSAREEQTGDCRRLDVCTISGDKKNIGSKTLLLVKKPSQIHLVFRISQPSAFVLSDREEQTEDCRRLETCGVS